MKVSVFGLGYVGSVSAASFAADGHAVVGVDVNPDMLRHLNGKIRDLGVLNVSTILAPPDDPLLPQPVDRFLIVDVWHHVEDQAGYLALMKKQLKPGGQVVMIDFHKKELPVGPPVNMKISREDMLKQMEGAGYKLLKEHTFLPYQYFLVFTPAG